MMVNLARGFTGEGYQVDLVLARAEGPYLTMVPEGVRIVDLGSRRVLYSLPGLVSYLNRERPVAMLSTPNHANIIAILARRAVKRPIRLAIREANMASIGSANAINLREKFMPYLMRFFYPWADVIIAVSHGVAEDLIKEIGVPKDKVTVIYNPVVTPQLFERADEKLKHPWFAPGEPPVIVAVGRLTEQKDFTTLIRAFSRVRRDRPARLMILGEGNERPYLEALALELGVAQDVAMPGFEDNAYRYMKGAAVFVLSSRWEGFPNVLAEALALGAPVVSTDCPSGPAEILEGGRWGKLVAVEDAEAMASAIMASMEGDRRDAEERTRLFRSDEVIKQYEETLGIGR
jgi:glycosyltransferase involved in cell wall biosynthesis